MGVPFSGIIKELDFVDDAGEDVADGGTKYGQDHDDDDGYQYENKSVLYQTLALFFRGE